jgi:hypothetical protein
LLHTEVASPEKKRDAGFKKSRRNTHSAKKKFGFFARERKMVSKNDFSPVEWKKLVQAPLLAGFAVSAADPSSFVGTLQGAFANAKQLAEAKSGASGELVKLIAEEILSSSGRAEARDQKHRSGR